ncbi:MAG: iron-containing alcohol dehydrogenase [Planctomycetes bacterium]|nr:iron-containing alcohol dehydrogenase [Planctomycetota bacterium]
MTPQQRQQALQRLKAFKGDRYVFGLGCFDRLGPLAVRFGRRATVVASGVGKAWAGDLRARATGALAAAGVELTGPVLAGARPNSPREDVFALAASLKAARPDVVVAIGGGSVIDAAKAAAAMACLDDLHPDIEAYFGVGQVGAMLEASGRTPAPLVAVQLAASSAAHLTKYANITDLATAQKKLIVDEAVVPPAALFDYASTMTMPRDFTADGALDGLSHCLEVFYGAKGAALDQVRPVATLGIELIVNAVGPACADGTDRGAREALGLGTDLGGQAIMIGGTNGAHLTSFSLVDLMSHGRACAVMNPYYTVLFAPAVQPQLRDVASILRSAGCLKQATDGLHGRDLGLAVAEGLLALSRAIGLPTRLADVEGFGDGHIRRALAAAKNPQLDSKLRNMPVPMSAETVDDIMGAVLEAARTGDFSVIPTLETHA